MIEPGPDTHRDSRIPERVGKMVRATFTGTGTRKILLLAHMDTVYPRGMLAGQPFRIEGDRAFGLGIADDRHGIAVIVHTLALLNAMQFREFGTLTVLINGDEEIGSPASRNLITRLGVEHDATLSFESAGRRKWTAYCRDQRQRQCHDHSPRPSRPFRRCAALGDKRSRRACAPDLAIP